MAKREAGQPQGRSFIAPFRSSADAAPTARCIPKNALTPFLATRPKPASLNDVPSLRRFSVLGTRPRAHSPPASSNHRSASSISRSLNTRIP